MLPETEEWVAKAEGDWRVALRELESVHPVLDAVCFHAQQCAEKYLKAVLVEHAIPFPKTHDLTRFSQLLPQGVCLPIPLISQLPFLTSCAVEFRYTSSQATLEIAQEATGLGRVQALSLPFHGHGRGRGGRQAKADLAEVGIVHALAIGAAFGGHGQLGRIDIETKLS